MKQSEIILISIAGIFVVGAVVGALFAPDKGKRTRRHIVRKGRRFFHSATDAWDESRDKLEEISDRLKDKLQNIKEEVEDLAHYQPSKR